jgi:hypothetical protein
MLLLVSECLKGVSGSSYVKRGASGMESVRDRKECVQEKVDSALRSVRSSCLWVAGIDDLDCLGDRYRPHF